MKRCTANWKNANEYPPVGCEEYEWLAWDFLRRNKKYAEHFKAISHLKPGEFEKGISPDPDSLLAATERVPRRWMVRRRRPIATGCVEKA
jgi:hypothetical protein